jgi:PAS domain S-box-containing protein
MAVARRFEEQFQPSDFGIGQLFDLIPDAVIVADALAGEIVLWNEAAEELFGYTSDEAHGLDLERLMPAEYRPRHRAGLRRFARTARGRLIDTRSTIAVRCLRSDGTQFDGEMRLAEIRRAPLGGVYVLAVLRATDPVAVVASP